LSQSLGFHHAEFRGASASAAFQCLHDGHTVTHAAASFMSTLTPDVENLSGKTH
jgi:hypothetical protein